MDMQEDIEEVELTPVETIVWDCTEVSWGNTLWLADRANWDAALAEDRYAQYNRKLNLIQQAYLEKNLPRLLKDIVGGKEEISTKRKKSYGK